MPPVHLQWAPSFVPGRDKNELQCCWITHLAILGVDVLVVAFDDRAVDEEAAHHHDHF